MSGGLIRNLKSRHDEAGTAIIEFVWLAILLLVPLVYIVIAVFETQRGAYATSAAARSAGRAFVTAPTEASAYARAHAAAELAFQDQGIGSAPMNLQIRCTPTPGNCLSPGSTINIRVASSARLPLIPDVLGNDVPRVNLRATHTSPYGTFREDRP